MRFRKKPIEIEATQWFKNGDHPRVTDGVIIRGAAGIADDAICEECNGTMGAHGWMETRQGGRTICPGDFIVTTLTGHVYPCNSQTFAARYEQI